MIDWLRSIDGVTYWTAVGAFGALIAAGATVAAVIVAWKIAQRQSALAERIHQLEVGRTELEEARSQREQREYELQFRAEMRVLRLEAPSVSVDIFELPVIVVNEGGKTSDPYWVVLTGGGEQITRLGPFTTDSRGEQSRHALRRDNGPFELSPGGWRYTGPGELVIHLADAQGEPISPPFPVPDSP
jgi:hypothetical protein